MFVIDDTDPLIRAYQKAFPELFTPGKPLPCDLREHFRYPEDLVPVQTQMWGRYHTDNPLAFYNWTDQWDVAPDPEVSVPETTGTVTTIAGQEPPQSPRVDPYYLQLRCPMRRRRRSRCSAVRGPPGAGADAPTSFMAVKSDPANAWTIESFVMPRADCPRAAGRGAGDPVGLGGVARPHAAVPAEPQCPTTNLLVIPIEIAAVHPTALRRRRGVRVGSADATRDRGFQGAGSGTLTVKIAETLQEALDCRVRLVPGHPGGDPRYGETAVDRQPAGLGEGSAAAARDRRGLPGMARTRSPTVTSPRRPPSSSSRKEKYEEYRELVPDSGSDGEGVVGAAAPPRPRRPGRHRALRTTEEGEARRAVGDRRPGCQCPWSRVEQSGSSSGS